MSAGPDSLWLRTDGGSDWLPRLTEGLSAIEEVISGCEAASYVEAPEGEALLAAVCVLASVGHDLTACPLGIREFVNGLEGPISAEMTDRATAAMDVVVDRDRSELSQLFWENEESGRNFTDSVNELKAFVVERRDPVSVPDPVVPEPGAVFGIPLPPNDGWALGVVGQLDSGRLLYYLLGPRVSSLPTGVEGLGVSEVVTWRSTAVFAVVHGLWPIVGAIEHFSPGITWPDLVWVNDYSDMMDNIPAPPSPAQSLRFEKKGKRLIAKKEWVDATFLAKFPRSSGGGFEIEPRLVADLFERVRVGGGRSATDWVFPGYLHDANS